MIKNRTIFHTRKDGTNISGPVIGLTDLDPLTNDVSTRGYMFYSNNTDFWNLVNNEPSLQNLTAYTAGHNSSASFLSNITMYSYTFRRFEPELWFTPEQIHDTGNMQ